MWKTSCVLNIFTPKYVVRVQDYGFVLKTNVSCGYTNILLPSYHYGNFAQPYEIQFTNNRKSKLYNHICTKSKAW